MNDTEARITRLEERYTHLQDHVAEQDRVILDLSEQITRLRAELARVQNDGPSSRGASDEMQADERPPHY